MRGLFLLSVGIILIFLGATGRTANVLMALFYPENMSDATTNGTTATPTGIVAPTTIPKSGTTSTGILSRFANQGS